ncbi:hypothetical protein LEN26_003030, partial [Aphanomyces euteiches]
MGNTRLPGVDRLIGSLATIGFGVVVYLAHQFLRPKPMTMDEYYRQKYVDPSDLVGHKGSCGCGKLTFIVLAPRSIYAFDDSNTFPSKMGRIPVMLAPMIHLQMTSNHTSTDIAVYSHQMSSTYATQHVFCKECGIHLFHMEHNRHDHVAINVYALESDHIEELRVIFVPKGAFPIFQRIPSSISVGGAPELRAATKQANVALEDSNVSAFEKQLMLWAQLDQPQDPEPAVDDVPTEAEKLMEKPREPVPLEKIPEAELARMKHQLQYYLQ